MFCLRLSRIDRNVTTVRALLALVLAMAVVAGCAMRADADDCTGLLDIDGGQPYLNARGANRRRFWSFPAAATNVIVY
jgi:hypothetical protein